MRNLITDVAGVLVGNVQDAALASGVTTVVFEQPAVSSVAIQGGAPGVRDTALLEPDMTVDKVDALVLAGGSAFGLDSMGGVTAALRAEGRGFPVGAMRVPIVPGAILFDLGNGGNKDWGRMPPYWELGFASVGVAAQSLALGTVGAGFGATTADLKGGLGSASGMTRSGFAVGALVAVNALGQTTVGDGPHFWAAPFERDGEFGGLGAAPIWPKAADLRVKGHLPQNTTIGIVATDAMLTKGQAKRFAIMAHDGMARAIRPSHAALDGDVVFAAATGRHAETPTVHDRTEIGALAADCLARAIARAIYEATALPFPNALPSWRDKFRSHQGDVTDGRR